MGNFAVASKTKELIPELSGGLSRHCPEGEEPYNLPSQLFSTSNSSYLRCLELTSVSLKLPADFNGLVNLKRLNLVDVSITDEDVQNLLSKCKLLECLEIAYCRMHTTIRTPYPLNQLKHLQVDNYCPLKR